MGRITYLILRPALLASIALTGSCTGQTLEVARKISPDSYEVFMRNGIEAALTRASFSNDVRQGCANSLATSLDHQTAKITKLLDSGKPISSVFFFGSDYISLTSISAGSNGGMPSLVYQDLDGLRSIDTTAADLNKLHSMLKSVITTDRAGNKVKVQTGLHESCAVFFSGSIRDGRFSAFSSNELEGEVMPATEAYKFIQSLVESDIAE